jgi:NAD(P)-dependent dehydrogenase (short-subunit alcohol dehydrogenase family)
MSIGELRFDDRVAVITGAGGGLGKQYALLLAARGVVSHIGGSVTGVGSNTEAASAVVTEIRKCGGEAVADSHSVTSPQGGQAIIDTALPIEDVRDHLEEIRDGVGYTVPGETR